MNKMIQATIQHNYIVDTLTRLLNIITDKTLAQPSVLATSVLKSFEDRNHTKAAASLVHSLCIKNVKAFITSVYQNTGECENKVLAMVFTHTLRCFV